MLVLQHVIGEQPKMTYEIQNQNIVFAARACASLKKCVDQYDDDELCAVDTNNGAYIRFQNKCIMLKHNCQRLGSKYMLTTLT